MMYDTGFGMITNIRYMRKILFGLSVIMAVALMPGCNNGGKQAVAETEDADTIIADCDQYVKFETSMGDFVIKLYRDTPLHRHNMVRQVRKGVYDGQLFFGVERKYKIQAGDPKSKNAKPGVALGVEEENDTIPGEINPWKYYHKRGAVGQASMRQVNYSTSQQFYIITGAKTNASSLPALEEKIQKKWYKALKDSLTQPHAQEIIEYREKGYKNKISVLNDQLNKETDAIMNSRKAFHFSEEQIKEYTTVGGAPTLDGYYTVFGEVIEGMEVVDSISLSHVDRNSRPVPDVKIIKATLIDWPESPAE